MSFTQPFKYLLIATALTFGAVTHATDLQPLLVANQKSTIKVLLEVSGELKNVPYQIQFSEFPAAAPLGEALNAGAVDIGALGDAPYVFALGAGAPLKVVSIIHAEGRNTTAILVPKGSPIKDVSGLKGKRIVTTRGSIGHYLAIKALRDAGLSTQDVQFVFLLPSESRLVLDNGTADAWSTWDPYTTVVTSQSQAKILVSGSNLLSNHLYLAATDQAIVDKRQQLDDFVARVDRAYRWSNEHPNEYAAAQAKVTCLPLAVHVAVAKATHMQPMVIDDAVVNGLQATADIYQEEGLLTRHIDVSQGFDKSFNTKRPPLTQASR
jgi:sulfonate transport system substrate-binding protein